MKRNYLAAGLAGAAVFTSALWCGALADRSLVSPVSGNPMQLYGLPIAAALSACGLFAAWWCREKKIPIAIPGIAAGLLLSISVLSLVRSHDLSTSLNVLLILAAALGAGSCAASAGQDYAARCGLFACLVASGAVVAAIGLNEYVMHFRDGDQVWRVFSTFAMPNFLAGFLVMHVPLAAAFFLSVRERVVTLLAGFALVMEAACLLVTGSRFGLLAAVAAFGAFIALAIVSGALAGRARKRTAGLLGICLIAAIIGARPIIFRVTGARGESYSSRFRTETWKGTMDMAAHNPLLGTGLGTFQNSYSQYARVGYTEHAHNSYLQFAAETGFLGFAAMLAILLIVILIGVNGVRLAGKAEQDVRSNQPFNEGILRAGLIAAIFGAVIRNLFDSDLYVAANALALASICGLACSMVKVPKLACCSIPRDAMKAGAAVNVLGLLLLGGRVALGRMHTYAAQEALAGGNVMESVQEFKSAVSADAGNSDYHLNLADVMTRMGDKAAAEEQYRQAIRGANIGKTHYRYGKFLMESGRFADAISEFESASRRDPHYLPNLLLLADAFKANGQGTAASNIYRTIVSLYRSPIGELRALPEQIPWEFAFAYLGLAEDSIMAGGLVDTENNLTAGVAILDEFWRFRIDPRNQVRLDVWEKVTRKYDWALEQLATAHRKRGDAPGAAEVDSKRRTYLVELEVENKKRQAPTR